MKRNEDVPACAQAREARETRRVGAYAALHDGLPPGVPLRRDTATLRPPLPTRAPPTLLFDAIRAPVRAHAPGDRAPVARAIPVRG